MIRVCDECGQEFYGRSTDNVCRICSEEEESYQTLRRETLTYSIEQFRDIFIELGNSAIELFSLIFESFLRFFRRK